MPIVTEGLNVKAICIVSALPQSQPPVYGNFPELAQPYAFLYFPISSQLGSKDKIITASLVPYYYLNGKLTRNVEFYNGGGESMNESEFEGFLNKQAADK